MCPDLGCGHGKVSRAGGTIVVSGDRVYDMALRLRYSQMECNNVAADCQQICAAITTALSQTPAGETLHILPTYSAMLEVRQVLTGRKIL